VSGPPLLQKRGKVEPRLFATSLLVPQTASPRAAHVERDGEGARALQVAGVDAGKAPARVLRETARRARATNRCSSSRPSAWRPRPRRIHYDLVRRSAAAPRSGAGRPRLLGGAAEIMSSARATRGDARTSSRIDNYLGFPAGPRRLRPGAPRERGPARRPAPSCLAVHEAVGLRVRGLCPPVRAVRAGELLSAAAFCPPPAPPPIATRTPGFPELTGASVYYGRGMPKRAACANQRNRCIGGGATPPARPPLLQRLRRQPYMLRARAFRWRRRVH